MKYAIVLFESSHECLMLKGVMPAEGQEQAEELLRRRGFKISESGIVDWPAEWNKDSDKKRGFGGEPIALVARIVRFSDMDELI